MPGQSRQIQAMAVKAQVTPAPVSCPRPVAGRGSRAIVWAGPCIVSGPDPAAGTGWDTVRASAADAGRRQAWTARHLAGILGRRLMPTAQPAKSAGTPPGDGDLDTTAAHPAQDGGRQPALPAGQQPARGALTSGRGGHATRWPGERQGLPPAWQHHGHRPRTWLNRSGNQILVGGQVKLGWRARCSWRVTDPAS